jgi:hypothetical protein
VPDAPSDQRRGGEGPYVKDAFVFDSGIESSVDLDAHRAGSDHDELDLGEHDNTDATSLTPSGSAPSHHRQRSERN